MSDEPKVIYSMVRVSKYFDKKPIIEDINLSYFYGAKIGVLGLNGSGKTTLLKILAGVDTTFNGETHLAPGYTIGYLAQEPDLDESKTVKDVVEEGAADLQAVGHAHAIDLYEDVVRQVFEQVGAEDFVQRRALRVDPMVRGQSG